MAAATDKAKDAAPATEANPLAERAFAIFRDMAASSRIAAINPDALAQKSFQLAAAFSKVADGVAAGEISTEPPAPRKKVMVKVPRMIVKPDFAGFEAVLDPLTKKPIIDDVPADHEAFAPNAPLDHPANARFMPLGANGRPLSAEEKADLINRTKADLLLAN